MISSTARLGPSTRCAIFLRSGRRCAWCERRLSRRSTEIDHVVPRSEGGSDLPENLVAACSRCNNARGHGEDYLARRLRRRGSKPGLSLSEAWRRVRAQLRRPLDLLAGRRLAARWYPWAEWRLRSQREAQARLRLRRLSEQEGPLGADRFPFGALAS